MNELEYWKSKAEHAQSQLRGTRLEVARLRRLLEDYEQRMTAADRRESSVQRILASVIRQSA